MINGGRRDWPSSSSRKQQQGDAIGSATDRDAETRARRNKPVEIGGKPRQRLSAGKGQRQPAAERAPGNMVLRSARIVSP